MTNSIYKNPNKFIQFELWKDCSIGCRFCCNKGQPKIDKTKSLNKTIELLSNPDIINGYNEIGIIGGELFNGEYKEVEELFYKLLDKIITCNFDKIYMATSLIFDLYNYLIPVLEYLRKNNCLDKCWLCTSYDVAFRFKTQEKLDLWKNNMKFLESNYPEVHTHVETIITQHFINAVLNKEFDLQNFCNYFHTQIDFIEPASGLYYVGKQDCEKDCPGFFPTKKSFIKVLPKLAKVTDLNSLLSMELRSETLYYYADGEFRLADNRRNGDGRCLLNDNKKYEIGFIDSDTPMRDVVIEYCKLIG